MAPKAGARERRQAVAARELFTAFRGKEAAAQREAEIAGLAKIEYVGRVLYRIKCLGNQSKGPHGVNAPEALLWSLPSLSAYRCPFHSEG